MKEYFSYHPGWFETNEKEVLNLRRKGHFSKVSFERNLKKIKKYFSKVRFSGGHRSGPYEIIDYTIREVPEKRNNADSAVLLCIKLKNGEIIAKRHNNSQWLSLEY